MFFSSNKKSKPTWSSTIKESIVYENSGEEIFPWTENIYIHFNIQGEPLGSLFYLIRESPLNTVKCITTNHDATVMQY